MLFQNFRKRLKNKASDLAAFDKLIAYELRKLSLPLKYC